MKITKIRKQLNNFIIFLLFFIVHSTYSQEKSFFKKKNLDENNSSFFKKNSILPLRISDSLLEKTAAKGNNIDTILINKNKINFLESPVTKGRLTSHFSKNRFHPVLKKWQAHKGTDFAAPYGTSINATAGGIVEKTGYTKANGYFVKIKHNAIYSTQYLHMSKISVKTGEVIKKGEKIGLVGDSGYATGPHVCYRFWKNGIQIDPYDLDFSEGENKPHTEEENISMLTVSEDEKNSKEFKTFVSGFFKKKLPN